MKIIVLLLLIVTIPQSAPARKIVPEYKPTPIIFVDEDGEEWILYPPFEKHDDGSVDL